MPGVQAVQEDPGAPAALPGAQATQEAEEVAPAALLVVPAGHGMHAPIPGRLHWPTGQVLHTSPPPPPPAVPAAQGLQGAEAEDAK